MKTAQLLKKVSEKAATSSIEPRCFPYFWHQPTPPKKIQDAMIKNK